MTGFGIYFAEYEVFQAIAAHPERYEHEGVIESLFKDMKALAPKQVERLRLGGDKNLVCCLVAYAFVPVVRSFD